MSKETSPQESIQSQEPIQIIVVPEGESRKVMTEGMNREETEVVGASFSDESQCPSS